MSVLVRFAPSPTGFLHIGGARTALFNWAFARHHKGQFLLRIEDTDRKRSDAAAIKAILDGLEWLGLAPDAPPVFQHANMHRHSEIAHSLIEKGHAYRCYCTPQDLEEMRDHARAQGKIPRYDGRCRDKTHNPPDRSEFVIRFKAPQKGATAIDDAVQGRFTIANEQLDDLILLRSDGTPTYMLSVVVDDHDMGITHIIRGDDHMTNAARQAQIFSALDWPIPHFAHIPLIHGSDGAKFSKRHGALGIEAYRDMGYLPAALRTYLARLGWSHGDEEIFSTEQFISWFSLEAIGKAPARFDFEKLNHINAHYIRACDDASLAALSEPDMTRHDALIAAFPVLKPRVKTLTELRESAAFLFAVPPLHIEENAKKHINTDNIAFLQKLSVKIDAITQWDKDSIESCIQAFLQENELKLGKIGPAIRVALTGSTSAPGLYDLIHLLGKRNVCKRLKAISAI